MIDWHCLFGLGLTDYFTGSRYTVEMEKDLSIKQQLLDVLIIEQGSGNELSEVPDGLENLAPHNLMTYKSLRQPLDAWALDELAGHYVNYRKQSSPSKEKLLPEEDFGLYAVSTRHPDKLENQAVLKRVKKGIYNVQWGSRQTRLIVLSEVAKTKRNALWLMFSGIMEKVQFGASFYNWRRFGLSKLINKLLNFYQVEGVAMPYTVEDFERDYREEFLASLTPEELVEILTSDEGLKRILSEDFLKKLPVEERLKGLTREEIETYLQKLSTSN